MVINQTLYNQSSDHWFNIYAESQEKSSRKDSTGIMGWGQWSAYQPFIVCLNGDSAPAPRAIKDLYILRSLTERTYIVEFLTENGLKSLLNNNARVQPANDLWKLSPPLLIQYLSDSLSCGPISVLLKYRKDCDFINQMKRAKIPFRKIGEYAESNLVILAMDKQDLFDVVINMPDALFFEHFERIPKEERLIERMDLAVNTLNKVFAFKPELNGNGIHISIKETRFDKDDIDFKNRYISTDRESSQMNAHASIMATIAAGAGNTAPYSRGVAWNAGLSSSDFLTLLPNENTFYRDLDISIQNHSYGVEGIENFYGLDAMAYDESITNHPALVHVFSSGNQGMILNDIGPYESISGFANLSGSFKMAKNILVVGSMDRTEKVPAQSSRGPAYDGRIKPELVALGESGSSSSAAIVTGVVALLQQQYKLLHQDSLPSASMIKAVLIASAKDRRSDGPDFIYGFGMLDAFRASEILDDGAYASGSISENECLNYQIDVPAGTTKINAALVWNDLPATPFQPTALINDLDLSVIQSSTNTTTLPWTLNASPHPDSLLKPAIRGKDSINNAELVTLDHPASGTYLIKVCGRNIESPKQEYSLAYQLEKAVSLDWEYPVRGDHITPGFLEILRWKSDFSGLGRIEIKLNEMDDWQVIEDSVDVSTGEFHWTSEDLMAYGQLKMCTHSEEFLSDTFLILKPLEIEVGFDCQDSVLLYWDRKSKATGYGIFGLGDKSMELIETTLDTFVVLGRGRTQGVHFGVAPRINGIGYLPRGITKDVTSQGVGCYINLFTATLRDNKVQLVVKLGTLYGVKAVEVQKYIDGEYVSLEYPGGTSQDDFEFFDESLSDGINRYRLKLLFESGASLISGDREVYFTGPQPYLVFPNPLVAGEPLRIISKESSEPVFLLYSSTGNLITSFPLDDFLVSKSTGQLLPGNYFYWITGEGAKSDGGKLVVITR